ncbi:hypothetical protein [Vibrio algivorus]|uniref:Uncharacterized protein n=1 Tax=Vibrio algivorus TaxID=1667024 RepID=A0A557P6E0_9VIBR|nr:hypothetical protein [Vibrio algivorus]TVO36199.1 hypothetical protein FOF44_09820 [Vibrio algivorus]
MSSFPIKSLKSRLIEFDRIRKKALQNPVFNSQAEERKREIEKELRKTEKVEKRSKQRKSQKPKKRTLSVLGGSRIDNAIID